MGVGGGGVYGITGAQLKDSVRTIVKEITTIKKTLLINIKHATFTSVA